MLVIKITWMAFFSHNFFIYFMNIYFKLYNALKIKSDARTTIFYMHTFPFTFQVVQ